MTTRRVLGHVVTWIAIILLLGLAAGAITGTPVFVSFVESGSMEPTLSAGDGFVAVPAPIAGPVNEGDVVVFEAQNLHGGGLTTHRVVGTTEQGYVTKGDANPFTDQDGQEPPVTDGQVRAKALQINGEVVRIPHLGSVVVTGRGLLAIGDRFHLGALSVAVGALLLVFGLIAADSSRYSRPRGRSRARDSGVDLRVLLVALTLVVILPLTTAMLLPGGVHEYDIVSADRSTGADHVIESGTTETRVHTLSNSGILPVYVSLQPASDGIAVEDGWHRIDARGGTNATVEISAPPETGYYVRGVVEYRYIAVLPEPVIKGLHGTHPWLPFLAINGVVGGGFYLVGLVLLGSGQVRVRRRSRTRDQS